MDGNLKLEQYVLARGEAARKAARGLRCAPTGQKNAALVAIAERIIQSRESILRANQQDVEAARGNQLSAALLDRLELNADRVSAMAQGLMEIASLPDPVGEVTDMAQRPSGIEVGRMRVPLGVVGIIYESRPNVTADAAGLCLKSGNAALLRGGSEAIRSNLAIAACIEEGLATAGLPPECVQVFRETDRAAVGVLLRMSEHVDVIVPRGGRRLIERVSAEATVPVIKHLDGNCHVYVDDHAKIDDAIAIAFNAKCRRYGICGSMETLLVAEAVAAAVLSGLHPMFVDEGVQIRGCPRTRELMPGAVEACEDDWFEEYLGPVLAVRVVAGLDEAIEHIARYGSNHTDAIVTQDLSAARRFVREVDSSSVMVNASTQFADGYEYGLGAEIGISTNKLHVRGPVGLVGLTTQKYVVYGEGTIRP